MDNYLAFQVTERRCRVCMSRLRNDIDRMLTGETERPGGGLYRQQDILAWAQQRGEQLSAASLSRHYSAHVQPALKAMLETEARLDALRKATGKQLTLQSVFVNILTDKGIRLLNALDEGELETLDAKTKQRFIQNVNQAVRNAVNIQRTEALLTKEEVAESVTESLKRRGLTDETIELVQRDLLGMR